MWRACLIASSYTSPYKWDRKSPWNAREPANHEGSPDSRRYEPIILLFVYNPADMKLSVIIPVYNEVESIEEILKRVKATKLAAEIVIVDDGSKDGTRDVLKKFDGKGNLECHALGGDFAAHRSLCI